MPKTMIIVQSLAFHQNHPNFTPLILKTDQIFDRTQRNSCTGRRRAPRANTCLLFFLMKQSISSSNFRSLLSSSDKLVEEYLLFRGFMQAHRAFVSECSRSGDRVQEFQVDKIVEELLRHLTSYNFDAMMDLWNFLDQHYMVRLEHRYAAAVKHLELSLQRFYLVNAVQCGQQDRVREVLAAMLEKNGDSFYASHDWTPWFALPYLKDAANSPAFKSYFTKDWASLLVVSIHNVLTTALQLAPLPALLSVAQHTAHVRRLEYTISEMEDKIRSLSSAHSDPRLKPFPAHGGATIRPASGAFEGDRPGPPDWPAHEAELDTDGALPHPSHADDDDALPDADAGADPAAAATRTRGRSAAGEAEAATGVEGGVRILTRRSLPGHSGRVNQCSVSGDAATVATVSSDASLRLCALPGASPAQADRAATIMTGSAALCVSWETRGDRLLLFGTAKVRTGPLGAATRAYNSGVRLGGLFGTSPFPHSHHHLIPPLYRPSLSSFLSVSPSRPLSLP
jgi:WD repeat-containing protein 91